jgi:sterol desaturase/sphingolipid hydroxylase (fatty acid hydroxylase superfamily)
MNFTTATASLSTMGTLLALMTVFSLVEALIPMRPRGQWGRRHLVPNLVLTLITFATNVVFNTALLLGLVWLQARGWGLFNAIQVPTIVAVGGAILALDLAWYVTHVSMHKFPAMWRFHTVHHSDPQVDVTTTVRQHPGESVIRYAYLAAFAFAFGASPLAFTIYRVWSASHGQLEHSNIKLPQWLDTAITFVFSSPNMHKIHHSRDQRFTDRNYSNIFSIWDRLGLTFTPSKYGRDIDYGLEGEDTAFRQSTLGLLIGPFRPTQDGASIPSIALQRKPA